MKILINRTAVSRALANFGPPMKGGMDEKQRRAMFARMHGGGGRGRTYAPSTPSASSPGNSSAGSVPGAGRDMVMGANVARALNPPPQDGKDYVWDTQKQQWIAVDMKAIPDEIIKLIKGATPPDQAPVMAKARPQPKQRETIQPGPYVADPQKGREQNRDDLQRPGGASQAGRQYIGGSPNFDESTGKYRTPTQGTPKKAPKPGTAEWYEYYQRKIPGGKTF